MRPIAVVRALKYSTLLTVFGLSSAAQGTLPIWSESDDLYSIERYETSSKEFSIDLVRNLAKSGIARFGSKKFWHIQVLVPSSAPCALDVKGYHIPYLLWSRMHDLCRASDVLIADVIGLGGVVIRYRGRDRVPITERIGGPDPLSVMAEGEVISMLHFAYFRHRTNREIRPIGVFGTISSIDQLDGKSDRVFTAIRSLFPSFTRMSLYLREDPWFIDEPAFPFLFPFAGSVPPPAHAEYSRSRTFYCYESGGKVSCNVRTSN